MVKALVTFDTYAIENGKFEVSLDRFVAFCKANEISDAKMLCTLLAVLGSTAYERLHQDCTVTTLNDYFLSGFKISLM